MNLDDSFQLLISISYDYFSSSFRLIQFVDFFFFFLDSDMSLRDYSKENVFSFTIKCSNEKKKII